MYIYIPVFLPIMFLSIPLYKVENTKEIIPKNEISRNFQIHWNSVKNKYLRTFYIMHRLFAKTCSKIS